MNSRALATMLFFLVFEPLVSNAEAAAEERGFWPGTSREDASAYPKPVPVEVVERAANIPRVNSTGATAGSFVSVTPQSNKAVRLRVVGSAVQTDLFAANASNDSEFLVLNTEWENIHPKQQVSQDALAGKPDRTMGVGGLSSGGSASRPVEYVEMDVAYKIPKLADHIYALVDGQAIALHPAMATLPGGSKPEAPFGIGKQGEVKKLQLAFEVPAIAENIALQVFDYRYGHILVPLRGDAELAKNSQDARRDVLDEISTDVVELAVLRLGFADTYGGEDADSGWRFAVVKLGGRSVSGQDGSMGKILQFDPTKYAWANTDGGFVYYANAGSTDANGNIRFTPETYQQQEVAFLVPESAERLSMGLRINRDVVTLSLTDKSPRPMPNARERHLDGDVMEILFHGSRRDGEYFIVDLGIKPLAKGKGLEVRAAQQFLLQTANGELRFDKRATAALTGHPPDPFVVPPGVEVRFELAYKATESPTALRVRGFRSEGRFEL